MAKAPLRVKQSVDVWSLGCVLSESAVWVSMGAKGLQNYRNDRSKETDRIPDFRDGDCFHDGERLLVCVGTHHHHAIANAKRSDTVTRSTIHSLIVKMLNERSDARPNAQQLWHWSDQLLTEARIASEESVAERSSLLPGGFPSLSAAAQPFGWGQLGSIMQDTESRPNIPNYSNTRASHSFFPESSEGSAMSFGRFQNQIVQSPKDTLRSLDELSDEPSPGSDIIGTRQFERHPGQNLASRSNLRTPPQQRRPISQGASPDPSRSSTAWVDNETDIANEWKRDNIDANILGAATEPRSVNPMTSRKPREEEWKAAHQQGASSRDALPTLSITQALYWMNEQKNGKGRSLPFSYLLNTLKQRDHVRQIPSCYV